MSMFDTISNYLGGISSYFSSYIDTFKDTMGNVLRARFEWINHTLATRLDWLRGGLLDQINHLGNSIAGPMWGIRNSIISLERTLNNVLNSNLFNLNTNLVELISGLSKSIEFLGAQVANSFSDSLKDVMRGIQESLRQMQEMLSKGLSRINLSFDLGFGDIVKALREINETLLDGVGGMTFGLQWIGNAVNDVAQGIVDIPRAIWDMANGITRLPHYLAGALSTAMNALFAEAGQLFNILFGAIQNFDFRFLEDALEGLMGWIGSILRNLFDVSLRIGTEVLIEPVFAIAASIADEMIRGSTETRTVRTMSRTVGYIASALGAMFGRLQEAAFAFYSGDMAEDARIRRDLNLELMMIGPIVKSMFLILGITIETIGRWRILGTKIGLPWQTVLEISRSIERTLQNIFGFPWLATEFWRQIAREFVAKPLMAYYQQLWQTKSLTDAQVIKLTVMRIFDYDFGKKLLLAKGYKEWKASALLRGAYKYPTVEMIRNWYARGWISEEAAKTLLARQKYIDAVMDNILREGYNELSRTEIEDLYEMGYIDEREIEKRLRELRYRPEDIAMMRELVKFKGLSSELNKLITKISQHYAEGLLERERAKQWIISLGKGELATDILLEAYRLDLELDNKRQKIKNLVDSYLKGVLSYQQLEEELSKIIVDPEKLELTLEYAQLRKMPYITPTSVIRYQTQLRRLYGMKESLEAQINYYEQQLAEREEYYNNKIQYYISKYNKRLGDLQRWYEREKETLEREYKTRIDVLTYIKENLIDKKPEELEAILAKWQEEIRVAPPLRKMWLKRAVEYLRAIIELKPEDREKYIEEQMKKVEEEYRSELEKLTERYEERKKEIIDERDRHIKIIEEQKTKELALINNKLETRRRMLETVKDEIAILERMGITVEGGS